MNPIESYIHGLIVTQHSITLTKKNNPSIKFAHSAWDEKRNIKRIHSMALHANTGKANHLKHSSDKHEHFINFQFDCFKKNSKINTYTIYNAKKLTANRLLSTFD